MKNMAVVLFEKAVQKANITDLPNLTAAIECQRASETT